MFLAIFFLLGVVFFTAGFRANVVFRSDEPKKILASQFNSCAVMTDRTVKCWGRNQFAQLLNGTTTGNPTPATMPGVTNAKSLGGGRGHMCAVITDGTIKCWGGGTSGQLGNSASADATVTPVTVTGITTAVSLTTVGHYYMCAILADETARCWGDGNNGQLGHGANAVSNAPVTVSGLAGAKKISASQNHACAVLSNGTVKCWGQNGSGQLGDTTTTPSNVPVTVSGITTAVDISTGDLHSCAVLANGTVRCWGSNTTHGQLGDSTNTNAPNGTTVTGITNAVAISAGRNYNCAILADGTVKCWGDGTAGQLGNGGMVASNSPVVVTGLTHVAQISAGGFHACARLYGGAVKCWGANGSRQVGDGTTAANRPNATDVINIP